MRNNFVLRAISYICILIFSATFIFGMFYSYFQVNEQKYLEQINDEEYTTDNFFRVYMNEISSYARLLIYRNNDYTQIKDNDKIICYANTNILYEQVQDLAFLIIYKNKALTNIELTSDTTTIEGLKKYINQEDKKHTTFINGEVKSDTELISKKAVQYFDDFNFSYYKTYLDEDELYEETEYERDSDDTYLTYQNFDTTINDFEIYSSYNEVLVYPQYNNNEEVEQFLNSLEPYSNIIYILIPISCVIVMICGIYLICSIGHKKDRDKIKLNTFDKIWFEVIAFVAFLIIGTCIAIPLELGTSSDNLQCIISIVITGYCLLYIISAITLTTFIKRIKARAFLNTTITGKVLKWCIKIIKGSFNVVKDNYNKLKQTLPKHGKLILYIVSFIIVEITLIGIFNFLGVIMDILLFIYLYNKIVSVINSYEKIENKLKDMYEGNNLVKLSENDVEEDFKDCVKYINDISNGFENAIKESIKSEHLKTELITNVSHDIKTPLTSIINYVDLLKQENIQNEKAIEYIKILDNKSQRLKKLTEDLVEASKASSGSIKLNIEKINIVELLKQSIGEFEDKFENKELETIFDYKNRNIIIEADSRYLYRVIENLFSNISKYALDKSRVYIDIIEKENQVNISIKNISKERLNISSDELMQRFVRGDKSRTTEGSGLGISIAKSLTELQHGKFNLQIDGDLFKVEIIFEK